MLANFAVGSHNVFDDYSYLKMLLSLTVFRHPPTYAHSIMVAKISFVITEYIAKYYPEQLVDLPGFKNVQDVKDKFGEILLFVWFSGLLHDIGKISYSHLVSFYARKLNDKEFEMIKQHSSKTDGFIKAVPDFGETNELYNEINSSTNIHFSNNPVLFTHFIDVAMGHHKSFDGEFGYPNEYDNRKSPVKLIIDIITIADSIDAATDSIGRSYAVEKKLSHLKEEILSQIGTRYSDFVAKLIFNNELVYNSINNLIKKDRIDVYYECMFLENLPDTMIPPNTTLF